MRLDWDLCREILLAVELKDVGSDEVIEIRLDDRDDRTISYHVRALTEGGYLTSEQAGDDEELLFTWYFPRTITYAGHQFLAATRSNATWRKVLGAVASKAGSVTLETLMALAVAEGERRLGLPD